MLRCYILIKMLRRLLFLAIAAVVVAIGVKVNNNSQESTLVNKTNQTASSAGQKTFDKNQYSTTDPTSIWVVVNKTHPLAPINYEPADLVAPNVPLRYSGNETMRLQKTAATAVEQLFGAAKSQNINLMIASGYRSYSNQASVYSGYVRTLGQATTDRQSAKPGYSEHQTGFAVDVEPTSLACELQQCFGETKEGKWLTTNAYSYGFIIRYPNSKEEITGYDYEPWHLRFVGSQLAAELHSSGITTLEEYFGIKGGQSYN